MHIVPWSTVIRQKLVTRSSASHKIRHILCNPKVYYRMQKTPLVPILSQINFHHHPLYFLQFHFNIPSALRFCKWPLRIFPPEPRVHHRRTAWVLHFSLLFMMYTQFRKMFQRGPGFVSSTNPLYDFFIASAAGFLLYMRYPHMYIRSQNYIYSTSVTYKRR